MYADQIKLSILKYLLKKKKTVNQCVLNELPFYDNKRIIDLCSITKNEIISFEIKSDKDSLKNLQHQINDLRSISDKIYIACGNKFKLKLASELPSDIGLICIELDKFKIIKRATNLKTQNIYALLSLLTSRELKFVLDNNNIKYKSNSDINTLRLCLSANVDIDQVKKFVCKILIEKHNFKINLLNKYYLTGLTLDDLSILNKRFTGSIFTM